MKTVKKTFNSQNAKKILAYYSKFNTYLLPKITNFHLNLNKSYIEFEWIEGHKPVGSEIELAFYELGKFHRKNLIEEESMGFKTLCHGDFHLENIIISKSGVKLIDLDYLNVGNNFSDLDYLDFFGLFDHTKFPWMINNHNCFGNYLKGAELKYNKDKQAYIMKQLMNTNIRKFYQNGQKENIEEFKSS